MTDIKTDIDSRRVTTVMPPNQERLTTFGVEI